MTSQQNKRKELEHILNKENFVRISKAIKSLREESPFKGAVELLTSYYDSRSEISIKRLIAEFFNDLKDPSLCEEVITEIKRDIRPETMRMLVTSCWQSGLDYTGYFQDFTKLFLSGDYMTALECFTVLECSAANLTKSEKETIIKTIKENTRSISGDKKKLAIELISILE
jgi:hypothetical protein